MVSRAKKPVLTLTNGPINNHNDWSDKLKDALGVFKRVWQVPFLWTLTFYLFWAARDIFVWNKSVWEGNYWNYVGITLSVAALLTKTSLAKRATRATVAVGTLLRTTFSRIPFQRVQTELLKTSVLVGTWTKKAASSTVLNAASGLKRVSAHVGKIIHGRIQTQHVYESAPTILDNDFKKPISTNYLEHQPLGVQQKSSTAARRRAPPMQRKLSMDATPQGVDDFLPRDHVFDENSMQCLVCSHLIECFCDENKQGLSERKHHTAMRCRFPKEPQSIEVVA